MARLTEIKVTDIGAVPLRMRMSSLQRSNIMFQTFYCDLNVNSVQTQLEIVTYSLIKYPNYVFCNAGSVFWLDLGSKIILSMHFSAARVI